jgi:nucleotide-binding universal stress UspA family protein
MSLLMEARPAATPAAAPRPQIAVVPPVSTVMLATDLGAASGAATARAIELAARLRARLLVLNVIDEHGRRADQERGEREARLAAVVEAARHRGAQAAFLVWDGDAATSIVAAAEAEEADIVVLGSRGLDRTGAFLLGSVSDRVVHEARRAVLIVPMPEEHIPAT